MRTVVTLVLAAAVPVATARAETVITWDQAEEHVGEEVTVRGRVLGTHCSERSCVLAFDPAFRRFTVVIDARSFEHYPPSTLDRLYSGRQVFVRGKVKKSDGRPQIEVAQPADLTLVHAERRQQRETERALHVQTELLERVSAVLAQLEELTERLLETQERMDTFLVRLEQREEALGAVQTNVPPPPPPPSFGEPQPRPAFESLRSVKRGMSSAEVQRLIGQPQYVESTGPGWTTWHYGYGRSISFDRRGKATSLVGFPKP
jgi:RecG-like helicase